MKTLSQEEAVTRCQELSAWPKSAVPASAVLVALLTCIVPQFATAGPGGGPSTEQLLDELEARNAQFDSFGWPARGRSTLRPEFLESYKEFNKRLWREHGMSYMYAPTVITQSGTQAGGDDFTANFQHNILFAWRPFESTRFGTGTFIANGLQVRQLTSTTGVDFTRSLGTSYFVSDSVSDSDTLKALYWRQDFPGDKLSLRLGHDELNGIVIRCDYACDDTKSFLPTPLSANPAGTMPGQGVSAIAGIQFSPRIGLEFGAADANGDGNLKLDRPFDTGELAYAATLTLSDPLEGQGSGSYRFSYYSVDETGQGTGNPQASSRGFAANFDQDIGDAGYFFRYAHASGRIGLAKQFASTGAVHKAPFGFDEDRFGFGFAWVDPSATSSKDEYTAETYYRIQLTPLLTATADGMVVINPSNNPNRDVEFVLSFRTRLHF